MIVKINMIANNLVKYDRQNKTSERGELLRNDPESKVPSRDSRLARAFPAKFTLLFFLLLFYYRKLVGYLKTKVI